MRKSIFHIVLSVFLALVVSDYVWIELLGDKEIVAELESEKEKESEEEVRENKTEGEEDPSKHLGFAAIQYTNEQHTFTGFVVHGNSFIPATQSDHPKRYLRFQQLRLPC